MLRHLHKVLIAQRDGRRGTHLYKVLIAPGVAELVVLPRVENVEECEVISLCER